MLTRRAFIGASLGTAAVTLVGRDALAAADALAKPKMTVYKSPTCGCCTKWVDHVKAAGIDVDARDVDDVSEMKRSLGVPESLWSCHTGVIDGYAVEGHVPAADILRLRKERPKVLGLAVPGMPAGSPGMEAPRSQPYEVIAFDKAGKRTVFAKH